MALLSGRQLAKYYETLRDVDVVFTKEVIRTLRLLTKGVYLKYRGHQIPCVIYSSSMMGAKIVANVKSTTFDRVRNTKNAVSLRFSFGLPDKPEPLSFYATCKIAGFSPYGTDSRELNLVSLVYQQRPPDDLIAILGALLETNINSKKRREERVVVTADTAAKLGLRSKEALLYIQNVARRCIVRDLSFSGARLIVPGYGRFLLDRPAALRIELDGEPEPATLSGKIVRIEEVADRDDIAAVALHFEEGGVPLAYKMRISEFLAAIGHSPREAATET